MVFLNQALFEDRQEHGNNNCGFQGLPKNNEKYREVKVGEHLDAWHHAWGLVLP